MALAAGRAGARAYRVWLSEIMLQQTTVATVTPRFERFIARWPTIEALAAAQRRHDPLRMGGPWLLRPRPQFDRLRPRGRGRGGFPRTAAELIELPGLGDYTAAAIAAIAFGENAAVVDTNVKRVIARSTRWPIRPRARSAS